MGAEWLELNFGNDPDPAQTGAHAYFTTMLWKEAGKLLGVRVELAVMRSLFKLGSVAKPAQPGTVAQRSRPCEHLMRTRDYIRHPTSTSTERKPQQRNSNSKPT